MGFGRFGDWGKGPALEGEPWIVRYTMDYPTPEGMKSDSGRIRIWTKKGKEGAIARVKHIAALRHGHVTIWSVYQPGRTPAGLYVPEGYEEVK